MIGLAHLGTPTAAGAATAFSLRRVSRIIDVLRNQRRIEDSEPEDVWLSERLGHHATGKVAVGDVLSTFSGKMNGGPVEKVEGSWEEVEESWEDEKHKDYLVKGLDNWRDGFYEPMGYHIGGSGRLWGPVWGH